MGLLIRFMVLPMCRPHGAMLIFEVLFEDICVMFLAFFESHRDGTSVETTASLSKSPVRGGTLAEKAAN